MATTAPAKVCASEVHVPKDNLSDAEKMTTNGFADPVSSSSLESNRPLSDSWRLEPLTTRERDKVASIVKACTEQDLTALAFQASTEGGFVEDEIRRQAWPILLGSDTTSGQDDDWNNLPPHKDESQVALDVHRAFVYYPRNESDATLTTRRTALSDLIVSTLRTHPSLSYFQGYHDIAQVLLLVLGLPSARPALARLSLLKIRDFLLPTLSGTNAQLSLLVPLLHVSDPHLCTHISGLRPYFALAAVLTMFAHDIESYASISRLFDYLLSHDAVCLIYMFVAMITLRKEELLDIPADEPEMLYAVLCKLPKPLDLEALIRRTEGLREMFPPETLPARAWSGISPFSALKTTRDVLATRTQTLREGEVWLGLQAREIERREAREEALKRVRRAVVVYRRPAGAVVLAVLVGVVSLWLGRGDVGGAASPFFRMIYGLRERVMFTVAQVLGRRV
ncbi:TBC1 domain family member 20 [Sphaceloma murrayae]|uniref:TBC1 domain family member 20 n=1 Tax=Sphaceloma murrayae TaxID=2082308 RepID=A0A2K1QPH3_9PEZI|nr:TBC1 domain family member 20 [Sphaceloma murrayae]